jgi:hypothetical protein
MNERIEMEKQHEIVQLFQSDSSIVRIFMRCPGRGCAVFYVSMEIPAFSRVNCPGIHTGALFPDLGFFDLFIVFRRHDRIGAQLDPVSQALFVREGSQDG